MGRCRKDGRKVADQLIEVEIGAAGAGEMDETHVRFYYVYNIPDIINWHICAQVNDSYTLSF